MPRSRPGPVTDLPSIAISPVVGSSNPAMMRSSVDCPQPEAQIMQTNSPFGMTRSIGASASTSSSPTAKRLVTPRMVRRSWCLLLTVLRAPAQETIADRHNDAVGDKAAGADHNHARYHEISARQRAAIHHDGAEAGRNAGHFADDDQDPGKAVRDPQSAEDRGQRGRQHDLPEHTGAGTAEHGGRFEQSRIDRAHAEHRVQQDRIKRAEEDKEDRRIWPQSEKDHRERQPRGDGDRAEQRDCRIEQLPQHLDATDHQTQGYADQYGEQEAAVDALHP